jgi:hypothetical protein
VPFESSAAHNGQQCSGIDSQFRTERRMKHHLRQVPMR